MDTSNQLAEAFRAELRQILNANGAPFTPVVASQLSRLAEAARAALTLTGGVGNAIEAIQYDKTPTDPDDDVGQPLVSAQASETFGAAMIREIMAALPRLLNKNPDSDPRALVRAIAEARAHGISDVAEGLELKLLGHTLADLPRQEKTP